MVATMNPLLSRHKNGPRFVTDRIFNRVLTIPAAIDKGMLRSGSWPKMYLTDPPCICVHFEIVYSCLNDTSVETVLIVRRNVLNPVGVTFATLQRALRMTGTVEIHEQRGAVKRLSPQEKIGTTIEAELKTLAQNGIVLSLDADRSNLELCRGAIPKTEEFEEMKREGRVVGKVRKAPCIF